MKEESTFIKPISNPLPCNTIVFRVLLKKRWINQDTGIIDAPAYLLRDKVHDNGRENELSVSIAELCSVEECTKNFTETFGVVTLHVGRMRDIGLDVVADHGHHASIKRLPHRLDNPAEAERIAGLLARQSRIFPEKKK